MRSRVTLTVVAMLLATLAMVGCSSDDQPTGPETQEQLSLPPVNTMSMDLGFFEAADVDDQSIQLGRLSESAAASSEALKLNYINAAVRVLFLNVVTYSALAEPVSAFVVAAHSVPQYQQDGSWLWTYIYVDDHGSEYGIFLRGKRMEDHVAWSMEVSSTDPDLLLDHFLWFAGEVAIDERSGFWQFYEPESSEAIAAGSGSTPGVQSVRIDWRKSAANDQRLALLINKQGDPAEGSTLIFEESPEMAMVEFYDAANTTTGTILWYPDGSGSIEWPDYKDGVKSCWDALRDDVDCR